MRHASLFQEQRADGVRLPRERKITDDVLLDSGPTQEEAEEHGSEAILKLRFFMSRNRSKDISLGDLARNLQTAKCRDNGRLDNNSNNHNNNAELTFKEMAQRLHQQCSNAMSLEGNLTISVKATQQEEQRPETPPKHRRVMLWGCRHRPYVRLPSHIHLADTGDLCGATDYSMMLKILWDDYSVDKFKYIATAAAKILISSLDINDYKISTWKDRTKKLPGASLYRMHLTDIGLLLQKEALRNITLDIYLKMLKEEDIRLSGLFYQEEISPYFLLLPSVIHSSECLLTLNPDKICEDARKKLLSQHGIVSLEKRVSDAVSVLYEAGLSHHIRLS